MPPINYLAISARRGTSALTNVDYSGLLLSTHMQKDTTRKHFMFTRLLCYSSSFSQLDGCFYILECLSTHCQRPKNPSQSLNYLSKLGTGLFLVHSIKIYPIKSIWLADHWHWWCLQPGHWAAAAAGYRLVYWILQLPGWGLFSSPQLGTIQTKLIVSAYLTGKEAASAESSDTAPVSCVTRNLNKNIPRPSSGESVKSRRVVHRALQLCHQIYINIHNV